MKTNIKKIDGSRLVGSNKEYSNEKGINLKMYLKLSAEYKMLTQSFSKGIFISVLLFQDQSISAIGNKLINEEKLRDSDGYKRDLQWEIIESKKKMFTNHFDDTLTNLLVNTAITSSKKEVLIILKLMREFSVKQDVVFNVLKKFSLSRDETNYLNGV